MLYQIEPEIQDGSRAFPTTQALFTGAPKQLLLASPVSCSWYGTEVDEQRGAFCLVKEGEGLGELVGEFLQITYQSRSVACYCLGESAEIATELATTRRTFMQLDLLSVDDILVHYEALA